MVCTDEKRYRLPFQGLCGLQRLHDYCGGSDKDHVWAVGEGGHIALRDNTGTWSSQSIAGASPPTATAIWGSAANNELCRH